MISPKPTTKPEPFAWRRWLAVNIVFAAAFLIGIALGVAVS